MIPLDIAYLLFLQDLRGLTGGFANSLFSFITTWGEGLLQTTLIAALFWCVNKRWGRLLLFANVLSSAVLFLAKATACVYRPFIRDSRLVPVEKASGYSFPSGHSTRAGAFWGGLMLLFRELSRSPRVLTAEAKAACRRLAGFFLVTMLLVLFSRNYLGVHTPQDVIIGCLLGLLVFLAVKKLLDWVQDNYSRESLLALGLILFGALLVLYASTKSYPTDMLDGKLIVPPKKLIADAWWQAGNLTGLAIGWLMEKHLLHFSIEGSWPQRLFRFLLGSLGLFFCLKALYPLCAPLFGTLFDEFFCGVVTMLYILVLYPWFCQKMKL